MSVPEEPQSSNLLASTFTAKTTSESGITTTTSEASTATDLEPQTNYPGKCIQKDKVPVDLDDIWKDACKDNEGNSFPTGSMLMSCCGCFKYVCQMSKELFKWMKELSPTCCETCDGNVVAKGTVIEVKTMDDACGTIKTSSCKIKSRTMNDGRIVVAAAIENEFHYEKCCGDESGVHPAGKTFEEVSMCTQRTCIASEDWTEAAWVTKQVFPGCDCCLVRGKMVPDGFNWTVGAWPVENWTCCKGKIARLFDNQVNQVNG